MSGRGHEPAPAIEALRVTRRFGTKLALDDISLAADRGEICGLIGPNGAGKTTLLRLLTGLIEPSSGIVRVLGAAPTRASRELRQRIGLVPSGDRSFYLRISGLENLVFFGRMHGLRRRAALAEAGRVLDEVGLADAQRRPVGEYSHGMQKRLSVARALLTRPDILLVDEATHDLDPAGASRIRSLVAEIANQGTAVVWATQRLDELRGFAGIVVLLSTGAVRFAGSLPDLVARSTTRRYVLRLRNGGLDGAELSAVAERLLEGRGTLTLLGDDASSDYLLSLRPDTVLGEALAALTHGRLDVLTCHEDRSGLEEAFLALTHEDGSEA